MNQASIVNGLVSGAVLAGVDKFGFAADGKKSIGSGLTLAASDVAVNSLQGWMPELMSVFDFLGQQKLNVLGATLCTFLLMILKKRDYSVKYHEFFPQLLLCIGSNIGGDYLNPYVARMTS